MDTGAFVQVGPSVVSFKFGIFYSSCFKYQSLTVKSPNGNILLLFFFLLNLLLILLNAVGGILVWKVASHLDSLVTR